SDTLKETLGKLQCTQAQLVQNEKMSGLGQLVAGIAHEINNPVNFIHGNLNPASGYIQDLFDIIALYQQACPTLESSIQEEIDEIDYEFLKKDLPSLISSLKIGTQRIREIVKSLRTFSRLDEADCKPANIHDGLDSTLTILQNRLKAKGDKPQIEVQKDYGAFTNVECYAGQLNQVFMNVLANAIDALEQARQTSNNLNFQPKISIQTELTAQQWVKISIANNGPSIPEAVQRQIMDPFFTTKPVGQGTGMGLAISYQIVVDLHKGHFSCSSEEVGNTMFTIQIPYVQQAQQEEPRLPQLQAA
ncbi:MAG: ATP-binding protein, partial [Cyanobacteria bacterium J06632_22]